MLKIYLTGISCVGKTTIGKLLAKYIDFSFYNFDAEIETYFQKPIEYIQNECGFMHTYRHKTSIVLKNILLKKENLVVASTPSGFRDCYLSVYKKAKKSENIISINLYDKPENILKRITFYDKESRLLNKILTEKEKKIYLKEIKKDITFFKKSLNRADYQFDLENLKLDEIAEKLAEFLIEKNKLFRGFIKDKI